MFLLLLWLWLRTKAEDYTDIPDVSNALPTPGKSSGEGACYAGKQGEFGGGGASASFDDASASMVPDAAASDGVVSEVLEGATAADELALRKTFWPFMLTSLLCLIAGWLLGLYAPDADSIGAVLQYHAQQVH